MSETQTQSREVSGTAAAVKSREYLIRLPRSSSRNAVPSFLKLLESVTRNTQTGYAFEGTILKPGRTVKESVLRPPGYPATPVLLECAGIFGAKGHVRGDCRYILWRLEKNNWIEIGRSMSKAWEWSVDLGPLAERVMDEGRTAPAVEVLPSLDPMEIRIRRAVEIEMERLEPRDQRRLVALLRDEMDSRFAASIESDKSIF